MLRATVQPLARQPVWSHVVFTEVDIKQMPVRAYSSDMDQLIVGDAAQGRSTTQPELLMPAGVCSGYVCAR